MNEAAKNISELLSGNYCKTIVVAGRVYVMKAPAIKVIMRATRYLSLVDIPNNVSASELLKIVSEHSENIIKGVSYLVVGDVPDFEEQVNVKTEEMLSGTHEELYNAFLVAFNLILGKDFFVLASLAMELAQMIIKPKSSKGIPSPGR